MRPVQLIAISVSYAENEIGRGARKVISDLNGSLGSRHFLYVMKTKNRSAMRTCVAYKIELLFSF